MKFESIRGKFKHFYDLIHTCGGTRGMIARGIPWEKVAWGRTFADRGPDVYFEIMQQKDEKGHLHFFTTGPDGQRKEWTKRDLAYMCDLYDNKGKLLNIMFLGM